jgi:hypothetical protein
LDQQVKPEPDIAMVRELSLFAQNTEWIYRTKHLPLVRNYSKKIAKGVYDDDLALEEILGSYVPFLTSAYKSQFGKDSIPGLDKRIEQALANELLDLVIHDIMEKKGIIS